MLASLQMKHIPFLKLGLTVRLLLFIAVPVVPLDSGPNVASLLGGSAALAKDSGVMSALDTPHEVLSLLQMRSSLPSQAAHPTFSSKDSTPAKRVVWINAFPRSGSSLLLSLVSQVDFPVFSLFEPCNHDSLEPWLAKKGCGALLSQLAQCNFTGVKWLRGWNSGYTLRNGASGAYSPRSASKACQSAGLVAFKTVTWGHNLASQAIPFLEENPQVKVINLVRDPRSIYASSLLAGGLYNKGHELTATDLTNMCDDMYTSLNKSHTRLLRVVYEDLVRNPEKTSEDIFSFMAIANKSPKIQRFLRNSFNNELCKDKDAYSTCRKNSTEPLERYATQGVMTPALYQTFSGRESCRAISLEYGYDPWFGFLSRR